jgi:hypothetical protein
VVVVDGGDGDGGDDVVDDDRGGRAEDVTIKGVDETAVDDVGPDVELLLC